MRENIQQQQQENHILREHILQEQRENHILRDIITQEEEIFSLKEKGDVKEAKLELLVEQSLSLQAENAALKVCKFYLSFGV